MSKKNEIRDFIYKKILILEKESSSGEGKAMLAQLRRGLGKKPGDDPRLFGVLLQDMPEDFFGKDGVPTKEEWACYIALTLYAMHQQGKSISDNKMNTSENISLGTAMRQLAVSQGDDNSWIRIQEKYKSLVGALDIVAIENYLRGIISLLKSKSIPINYSMLAVDLYEIQFADSKSKVILRWGQDLYRVKKEKE
jgi:CRISPR system Cascade subunit CasB